MLFILLNFVPTVALFAQVTENFENLPTDQPNQYLPRTWTGTEGGTWNAMGARTDRTLNGKAICFGTSGDRNVTSPIVPGGMGTLSFNYVRDFTGTGSRYLEVWVNGMQIGPTIIVSSTSDQVMSYSAPIAIGGDVQLQIRSTGTGQVKIDDINWTSYSAGPTIGFDTPEGILPENTGAVVVDLSIDPPLSTDGSITVHAEFGNGAYYGPNGDLTSVPPIVDGTFTLPIAAGQNSISFTLNIIDDNETENDETITFTLIGASEGLAIGNANSHTITILDDDETPTVNFASSQVAMLESAGSFDLQLLIFPTTTSTTTITIQIDEEEALYGTDYSTDPPVNNGTISIDITAGTNSIAIPITLIDDQEEGPTGTVEFTITASNGDLVIGDDHTFILSIGDDDAAPTTLGAGDLVVVGVNANDQACGGGNGQDRISFFSFEPIVPGTSIIITDNGFERCAPGLWGNSEGTVRMTRTGVTIPAGQVITFSFSNDFGGNNVIGVSPDANWTCTSLNGTAAVNLNLGGDQLFFMQGGTWDPGTPNAHNATFDGEVLFAFTTNAAFPWDPSCTATPSQRSALPPGTECFSMAPDLATDFNKYVGPITPATQRNWIIRINEPENWATYAGCNEYSNTGYNWLAAPILPIEPGSFQDGKWLGAENEDWFNCRNWDDVQVPQPGTDVLIDESALQHCVIGMIDGLQPGGDAECASVTITNSGTSRNLTIAENSGLIVNGAVQVERTAGNGALLLKVENDASLETIDLQLSSINANEARLIAIESGSHVSVRGNLGLLSGGRIELTGNSGNGGTLALGGNYINLATADQFQGTHGTIILNGTADQSIATAGEVWDDLIVDKDSGDVLLAAPLSIEGELQLIGGRVHSSTDALFSMLQNSTVIEANDSSFIHGPMQRSGLSDFVFPIGKGDHLRPCAIKNISGAANDSFIAEYFDQAPPAGTATEPFIGNISECEHWRIERGNGNANAMVELSWKVPPSCGPIDPDLVRIAYLDDDLWTNQGNGGTTGDPYQGTVITAEMQTQFGIFTLAEFDPGIPLPVELISFDAVQEGDRVRLQWSTASEVNNAYFTIERSADATGFDPLIEVPAEGSSSSIRNYSAYDDHPLRGFNYYRLKQTDLDGTFTYSHVAAIHFSGSPQLLIVQGEDGRIEARHDLAAGSRFEVIDIAGRVVQSGTSDHEGRTQLPVNDLPRGTYIFRISDGSRVESAPFLY